MDGEGGPEKAADYYFLHNCSTVRLLLFQLEWVLPGSGAGAGQEHCEPDEAAAEITSARFKRPRVDSRVMKKKWLSMFLFCFMVPWLRVQEKYLEFMCHHMLRSFIDVFKRKMCPNFGCLPLYPRHFPCNRVALSARPTFFHRELSVSAS